ncbi:MAG: signal transduction histidine kinase [Cyclobacteriaceae bacterium]|jgi:signal transduction histidine kinase
MYLEVLKTGQPMTIDEFEVHPKFGDKYVSLQAFKVGTGLGIVISDITEYKRVEKELIIAKEGAQESDRLKSAFLVNMSHEIRTPLNGILGFAELLKIPNLDGERQQEYIRIIEKSGDRMLNIVNDIVSISKIESGLMEVQLSESNVNDHLQYIHNFFEPEMEEKGLKFYIKPPLTFEKVVINTDRDKILAVLTNLVKNAIKFTEKRSIEIGFEKKR